MEIGLFGGSFDPPHFGHQFILLYAIERWGLDRIIVTPCYRHPFSKTMAPFKQRVEMVKLLIQPFAHMVMISELEKGSQRVNYTIDTIKKLKEKYPHDNLHIIVGSDICGELSLWKDYELLKKEAHFIIIGRGGFDMEGERVYMPEISSSMIRKAIFERKDISPYVPKRIVEYIERHALYRRGRESS